MTECPKSAIEMKPDEFGFLYPNIDGSLCVKCGKCMSACVYKEADQGMMPKKVYGALAENTLYQKSTSGGAFSAIATSFMKNGGFVAGAAGSFENNVYDLKHIIAKDSDELEKIFGSKYVHSRGYEVFDDVKKTLSEGKKVLFSGTPCQVAAIKELTHDDDNLFTVDIICHGVPSVSMFNDCLKGLSKELGSRIMGFCFRDKAAGGGYKAVVRTEKGKYILSHGLISFYKLFLDSVIFRENCYSCPYAGKNRVGDITLGDFWGFKEVFPLHEKKDRYWSCVLVNSEKGKRLFEESKELLEVMESDIDSIAKYNHQLNAPSLKPSSREMYQNAYKEGGYGALEKLYTRNMGGIKFALRKKWNILRNKK